MKERNGLLTVWTSMVGKGDLVTCVGSSKSHPSHSSSLSSSRATVPLTQDVERFYEWPDLIALWFIFPSSASQVYMGLPFCHNFFSESLSFWERRVGFSWWIKESLQVTLPRDFGYFPTQEGEIWGSKNMSPRCRHKDCIFLSQANWDNCCN